MAPERRYLNQSVVIQSRGAEAFLCHAGGVARGEARPCPNCLFTVRMGLSRPAGISFEAVSMPGYYLSATRTNSLELQRFQGTTAGAVASTFALSVSSSPDAHLDCELAPLITGQQSSLVCLPKSGAPATVFSPSPSASKANGTDLRILCATTPGPILTWDQ